MTPRYWDVCDHLQRLRLVKSKERSEALLQEGARQELPYADFMERVCLTATLLPVAA
jgi:hypothetical protein